MRILKLLFFSSCFALILSCNKEELSPECDGSVPTYDSGIKSIISSNCGGGSCHGSGSNRGDYTTYAGMKNDIDNGSFEREVLIDQSMPRGRTLSQNDINQIQCWVDNGYPEN